jgi:hypothetical protein
MANAQRAEERVNAKLPVEFEHGKGITRDVSASGVFFETNAACELGSELDFALEFDSPGGPLLLRCKGTVVRVEQRDGKMGIAAKITESCFEELRRT